MRRIIPSTLILLVTLAATVVASAGRAAGDRADVVVYGRVVDDATNAPLAGAAVILDGTTYGAVTAGTGEYRLEVPMTGFAGGSATLIARAPGYQPAELILAVRGTTIRADFRMVVLAMEERARPESAVATGAASAADVRTPSPPPPPAVAPSAQRSLAAGAVTGGHPYPPFGPREPWNTEAYAHIVENAFLSTAGNPLSTFSIDVDRASYSNVRRFLMEGQLPPADAVRTEEMINYFAYDYPAPRGEHPFAVGTEVGPAPWRPGHQLLRIGLASPAIETGSLPPSNLVFLLDVSGSMQSPDKLPLVKQSLRMLVGELRPQDRVAIVVYAGAAGLVLPSTPGRQKERILDAIEKLEAGGSTAGGEGLRLAYRVARENHLERGNNRVILATDGDFNVGVSSDAEMIRLVEERRAQGTYLTVLGFGTGNLKDSKMEQMADHGNGNYAYIDSLLEARKVLVTEMGGTLLTVASDVKLQVEFNPARVRAYRLIGYENRLLAPEDFNDDTKDAGELGAGHTVTALYEVIPVGVETEVEVRGTDPLRYQEPPTRGAAAASGDELAFVRVRYKHPGESTSRLLEQPVRAGVREPSDDLVFASAVAGFGMLLRDSEHGGSLTADRVIALARAGKGVDRDGYRAEFVRLVELYRSLARSRE